MQPNDLFSVVLPKAGKARRNSPRTPSAKALNVVRNLDAHGRMEAARDIIVVFGDLGVDRKKLADHLGLSHSSTSHWHHGANSISAHNLAVLVDTLHEYLRPSLRGMLALNGCRRAASLMSSMGLMWAHTADVVTGLDRPGSTQPESGSPGQPDGEPVASVARGEITWTHHADGSFTALNMRIVPAIIDGDQAYRVTVDLQGLAGPRRLSTDSLADAFAVCQHLVEACG